MIQGLTVELGARSYPIHFVSRAADALKSAVAEMSQSGRAGVLLTDAGVAAAQAEFLEAAFGVLPRLVVDAGERSKSLDVFGRVQDFLAAHRVTRQGVLWVVGGGVPGDLGGFAAASYLRGIAYVQVPTTLLAMVDSSVGGKTGINLSAGKNLVGAFHHPRAVYIAAELLRTLPPREFAAGAAEIVKYGLLGDAALFARLERAPLGPESADLPDVIRRCCEIKADIVRADELEMAAEGGRALLNLGHTFGHAIEQATGYAAYLHGEAVAVGLAAAARLSRRLGLLAEGDVARVDRAVLAHGLPARLRAPLAVADLQAAAGRDKKNRADGLRYIVLDSLGAAATRLGIPAVDVEAVWREIGAV
jgi:3-dehydroquinate synthase